jgi:hypothetical protein
MREASCGSMMLVISIYLLFIVYLLFIGLVLVYVFISIDFYLFIYLFIYDLLLSVCSGSMCKASCGSMMPAIIIIHYLYLVFGA